MTSQLLRIATRRSPLAMRQAEIVRDRLALLYPDLAVQLIGITTLGDRSAPAAPAELSVKAMFTKELEESLLSGAADAAVHSMKDVSIYMPDRLHICSLLQREDPRDALISGRYSSLGTLASGARIGTSSLRRRCQLLARRSDLEIIELRGNVNTRLRRLDQDRCDALILAAAGLKRLGLQDRIAAYLDPAEMLPAGGQGAIGIQVRKDDERRARILGALHDEETSSCVRAERALGRRLEADCRMPIAAYACIEHGQLRLQALLGSPDGTQLLRAEQSGAAAQPEPVGERLAEQLLSQGADRILRQYGLK